VTEQPHVCTDDKRDRSQPCEGDCHRAAARTFFDFGGALTADVRPPKVIDCRSAIYSAI
jgi:hypothetical protein